MEDVVKILIVRDKRPGSKGYKYKSYLNGELLTHSKNIEFATCRVLQANGMTGYAQFYRDFSKSHTMRLRIGHGATLSITETDKTGPRLCKFNSRFESQTSNGLGLGLGEI